jgi:hypothetical protein
VADGGPPSADTLTSWTLGDGRVDSSGSGVGALPRLAGRGLTLVALLHAGVLIGTYTLVLAGARRGGELTAAVALVGAVAVAPLLTVGGNIRTQTFALAVFAAVL